VKNRQFPVVRLLVTKYGADYNLQVFLPEFYFLTRFYFIFSLTLEFLQEFDGKSPLHHAVATDNLQIAEFLLSLENICVDPVADRTTTPLIRCALLNTTHSPEIAKLLIKRGADLSHQGDKDYHDYRFIKIIWFCQNFTEIGFFGIFYQKF
jgi:ankyrin repeat protein